jgi:sec-independent protein translocase protein TatA
MLNTPEIIVIGVVVFIFVGAKRMPELAKSLGQGIREFKKATSEATDEAMKAISEGEPSRPSAPSKTVSNPEVAVEPHAAHDVPTAIQSRKSEEQV